MLLRLPHRYAPTHSVLPCAIVTAIWIVVAWQIYV